MHYVVFDFDGVLGDTFEASIEVRLRMQTATTRMQAIEQIYTYSNNPVDHTKDHIMTHAQMQQRIHFLQKWGMLQDEIGFPLFDQFIQEIKKIPSVSMAVVSSNSTPLLHKQLDVLGLPMTHMLWFEDHHSKEEKILTICRDWSIDVSQVYYITDTKADVYELQWFISSDKLLWCARWFSGYDNLAQVLEPSYIMKSFDDIHHHIAWVMTNN